METKYIFPIILESDKSLPIYVVTADIYSQAKIYRPYGIPHHQLLYTVEGSGYAKLKGKKYILTKDNFLYLPPHTPQNYSPVKDWVTIYITYVSNIDNNYFTFNNNIYFPAEINSHIEIAKKIIRENKSINFCLKTSHLIYQLLLKIKNELDIPNYKNNKYLIEETHKYILNHFTEDIELADLADICGFVPEYFCKIFKLTYNISPFKYIMKLRMQAAKQKLVSTDANINVIASSVGFKSTSHFIDLFKKQENMTPSQFRKENKIYFNG